MEENRPSKRLKVAAELSYEEIARQLFSCNITESCILTSDLMVSEVFSRLPIKSLFRCKAVCKAWKDLINDPNFAKNIYEMNPPFATLLIPRKLAHCDMINPSTFIHQLEFDLLEFNSKNGDINPCSLTRIDPKLSTGLNMIDTGYLKVAGSCNGLLLLCTSAPYGCAIINDYICNPLTGEILHLPKSKSLIRGFVHYSFGQSSKTKQFKVLRVASDLPNGMKRDVEAEILTVGVDVQWRSLSWPGMYELFHDKNGYSLNGVCHWIKSGKYIDWIHTFDLGEEKLGADISLPPELDHCSFLKVLNDHLSVFDYPDFTSNIIIWTMKEYGVEESWTKNVISKKPHSFFNIHPTLVIKDCIVAGLRSGDIIFWRGVHDDYYSFTAFSTEQKKYGEDKFFIFESPCSVLYDYPQIDVQYSPCFSSIENIINEGGSTMEWSK